MSDDVDEVLIEGKNGYDISKKLTKNIVPAQIKNIKLFKDKDRSLFSKYNIETQINELFGLNVKLESGGSIVINTTEALVAIDVNSGKSTSERNIESTALKTINTSALQDCFADCKDAGFTKIVPVRKNRSAVDYMIKTSRYITKDSNSVLDWNGLKGWEKYSP